MTTYHTRKTLLASVTRIASSSHCFGLRVLIPLLNLMGPVAVFFSQVLITVLIKADSGCYLSENYFFLLEKLRQIIVRVPAVGCTQNTDGLHSKGPTHSWLRATHTADALGKLSCFSLKKKKKLELLQNCVYPLVQNVSIPRDGVTSVPFV